VQSFLDQFRKDMLSHDMKKISRHYAADFKQDGYNRKAFLEILSKTVNYVTKYEIKLTKLSPGNNSGIAFIDGSVILGAVAVPLADDSMIIKESGVWKWYGNQK